MTLDDLCRSIARMVVENYALQDMVTELRNDNQELKAKVQELEEPPPPNPK